MQAPHVLKYQMRGKTADFLAFIEKVYLDTF